MKLENPFETLQVPETATMEEIKAAYRLATTQHHPDRNPSDPQAHKRMSDINAAWEELRNDEGRAAAKQRVETARSEKVFQELMEMLKHWPPVSSGSGPTVPPVHAPKPPPPSTAPSAPGWGSAPHAVPPRTPVNNAPPRTPVNNAPPRTPVNSREGRNAPPPVPQAVPQQSDGGGDGWVLLGLGLLFGLGAGAVAVAASGRRQSYYDPDVDRNRDNRSGRFTSR